MSAVSVGGGWAVILGVSSGTGAAIARAIAESPGLHVFGVHRGNHPGDARALEDDVRALGRRVHLRRGDAGTVEGAAVGADELASIAGPGSVKLFVHSIAGASVGRLAAGEQRVEARQIQRTFDAMAHSFVYWTQELVARDLLAPGAHLLGLTNPMTETVVQRTGLIAATKAALEMYVRHLAHELGPLGHRVNLLKFGAVMTPAIERTFGEARLRALTDVLRRGLPARRLCTLEEVARFVSVLAGDEAAWFNGATIDFTGGEVQGHFEQLLAERLERDAR